MPKTAVQGPADVPTTPTSAEIDAQIVAEREALDAAIVTLMDLVAQRDEILLTDDDAALVAIDEQIARTGRDRDRHAARARKLEEDARQAQDAEREAERLDRYNTLRTQVEEATRLQRERYPVLAKELAQLLQTVKEVDGAVLRYQKYEELPDGCDPIIAPSFDRHVPFQEGSLSRNGYTPLPLHEVIGELPAFEGNADRYWPPIS